MLAALRIDSPRRTMALAVVVLTLLTLVKGIIWIAALPALMIADEPAHFDNVQFRAEHHAAPHLDNGGRRIERIVHAKTSPEVWALWLTTMPKDYYSRKKVANPELPARLEEIAKTDVGRNTDGQTTTIDYPGFYYQLAVPFYGAFRTSPVTTRITAVRLLSLLFGLLAVLATYFAAQSVMEDAALAFVAAAMVSLQPMTSQMTSAVNNDAAIIGLSGLLFFFQVRTIAALPKLPSIVSLAGMVLTSLCIVYTKPTGYGILPGVGVALLAVAWHHRHDRRVRLAAAALVVTAIAGYVVLSARGHSLLAMLPGDTSEPGEHGHESFSAFLYSLDRVYVDYLVRSAWGQFGWLDYSMGSEWVDRLRGAFRVVLLGTAVAAAVGSLAWADRERIWFRASLLSFAIFTVGIGLAFILFVEHRFRLTGVVGVIQGRNFLFVMPAFAVWIVVALGSLVPRRMRGLVAAALFTGMVCMNGVGLITILRHHYVR